MGRVHKRAAKRRDGSGGQNPGRKSLLRNCQMRGAPEQLAQFFQLSDAMFVALDRNGTVTCVNPKACRVLGCRADEVVGKNWFQNFLPVRLRGEVRRVFGQLMAGRIRAAGVHENPVLNSKGEERIVLWHNTIIRGPGRKIMGSLSSGTDITERKKVENELRNREEHLKVTLDSIGDAVVVTDRKGNVTHMNPRAEQLTGWTAADATGRSLKEVFRIVNAANRRPAADIVQRVLRTNNIVGLANHTMLVSKHGKEHQVADSAAPLRMPDGSVRGIVIVFRDVTREYAQNTRLQESEERFRVMFEFAGDAILVAEPGTRKLVMANRAALKALGYSQGEIIGNTIDFLHPANARETLRRAFDDQCAGRIGVAENMPVVRQDGSVFYVDINSALIRFGGKTYLAGIFRDVTARRQAERVLKESEERFREIIETTPFGVHLYSLEADGRLVFSGANSAADSILGVKNDQFVGKTIEEAFPPLASTPIPAAYRRVAGTGRAWSTENVTYKDRQISGAYEVHAFQTAPGRMAAMFRDITARKKIETALQTSETRYRTLMAHLPDMVARISADMRVVYANESMVKACGFDALPDDLALSGLPFGADALRIIEPAVHSVLAGESPARVEVSARLARGPAMLDVMLAVEKTGVADPPNVLFVARDVTELQNMEMRLRHAEKMEAIGQLASGVAHDFNNQLLGVLGYAELLDQRLSHDLESKAHVDGIITAARRSSTLVAQLLSFARKGRRERTLVDVCAVARDVISMLGRTIDKRITVMDAMPPGPIYVLGDSAQLQNAMLNIGINARDALPEGGEIRFGAGVCTLEDSYCRNNTYEILPGQYALVSISDNGIGMDPEVQKHIFDPFFTTKRRGRGTGMGLTTVYGMIRHHQGAIDVESEVGKGSTFTLYLPLAPAQKDREQEEIASVAREATVLLEGRHVLVIDDEEFVCDVAKRMLEQFGCRSTVFRNALAGIEHYSRCWNGVDVVVLDMIMPEMNGRDVFAKLKGVNPDVCVLLLSGYAKDADIEYVLDNGGAGFVQKPFRASEFREGLMSALRKKKPV